MAYNAALIAAQRARKDSAAKKAFRSGGFTNLPFVQTSEFQDGDFQVRLWPEHPQKIPAGYLRYRSHKYEIQSENDVRVVQCPRSTNWDPLPLRWEDSEGNEVPMERVDPEEHWPVFKERCYACELTDLIAREGRENDFSEAVSKRVLPNLYGTDLDHFFYPCTIKMEVASRRKEVSRLGKEYEVVDYRPSQTNLFKCILKLRPGTVQDFIENASQQVPDLNNLQAGRWFTIRKVNGGRGVGGYQPMLAPYPSAAGFELADNDYQNFWTWGTGGKTGATKRATYSEMEALAGDPSRNLPAVFWWAKELREMGVPLTDAEAEAREISGVPF
ncbi:MAG: hypothetical protein EOM25_07935 [Deltaproteobacteria bacterium]|nr:hypothetical protein [Deltaproteobacteria bacterium]